MQIESEGELASERYVISNTEIFDATLAENALVGRTRGQSLPPLSNSTPLSEKRAG
jgi:hypothetical protein